MASDLIVDYFVRSGVLHTSETCELTGQITPPDNFVSSITKGRRLPTEKASSVIRCSFKNCEVAGVTGKTASNTDNLRKQEFPEHSQNRDEEDETTDDESNSPIITTKTFPISVKNVTDEDSYSSPGSPILSSSSECRSTERSEGKTL